MKYLMMMFVLVGCYDTNTTAYKVPQGYNTCRYDYDCADGEYCTFIQVDTYAVCRPDSNFHYNLPGRSQ